MNKKDQDKSVNADDEFATIIGQAQRRQRPSEQARTQAFDVLHARWQKKVRTRRRRTVWVPVALAATMLVGVLSFWIASNPQVAGPTAFAASVVRLAGEGATITTANASVAALGNADVVPVGALVGTQDANRVAFNWGAGGSLRLDENTRVQIVAYDTIRLLSGSVYYDSQSSAPDWRQPLTIESPLGRVRHIGTQFMVRLQDTTQTIAVREGKVQYAGANVDLTLNSGQSIALNDEGVHSREPLAADAPVWRWVEGVAPLFDAEGRSAADILDWFARETGHKLIYHGRAHQIALDSAIHGVGQVDLDLVALIAVAAAAELKFDRVDGTIVVAEREPAR